MVKYLRDTFRSTHSTSGQIIIMVAFFAVVLVGMIGLSIDLGYAFAQKRSVQNAADAAALAGAHTLTQWSLTTPLLSADGDVSSVVNSNKMNSSTTQTYTCNYLDDAGTNLGPCSIVVPPTATGVHVVVRETHSTFFIRVVPFGPKTVTTSASATSHVQGVTTGIGSDSPFIVCGIGTNLVQGGSQSILNPDGSINPDAYGKTYYIHAPNSVADCGFQADKFKGLADNTTNFGRTIPGLFDSTNGTVTGPTQVQVNGVTGCAAGLTSDDVDNCVLIVPIASNVVGNQFYVVTVGAFLIQNCHVNCHEGTLLKDYVVQPNGQGQWTDSNGWKPGDKGLATVRLTN